jgi:predicted nuclease of predicted toxin-antitoxin system
MSTPDAGMLGATDERHLALARSLGRILFTQDDDFLRLNSQGIPHTGIVYTHQSSSISRVINGLMKIHETKGPEDMIGRVEFI